MNSKINSGTIIDLETKKEKAYKTKSKSEKIKKK